MKIIVASGNIGKISEIKSIFPGVNIIPYFDLIEKISITEDADTFEGNAIKKALCIYDKLSSKMGDDDYILSDDSGISVEVLGGEPGIYSARYATLHNKNVSDKNTSSIDNINTLIANLKSKKVSSSKAFYTAILVLVNSKGDYKCFDGYMHGAVICETRGNNGFGYDPIFIPDGHNDTLGQMSFTQKQELSHRYKALVKIKQELFPS
ncbi:Nucleoside 5-triphosphatase RdgB (dHAPTP, dITP, XTP-specific) [hydrothermal vent metagenome]|uniref:Nucleoside 5-triphosphatase RdgB (DHAPTP, dITP, XTP-specific) n=1 Tax=hydrothermal vent metagenome TaxID=652676 RepID=A0A3B1EA13_9ZZZZ